MYILIICIIFLLSAPGTYSPEKVNLNKGPQYSLSGKGPAEKLADTPGMIKVVIKL